MILNIAKTALLACTSILAIGCCGGRICAVRFHEPLEHLGQTPREIPYHQPPAGFQTVGGPPSMQGPATPPSTTAPLPRFIPVPTRPVFAPYEIAIEPAGQSPKMQQQPEQHRGVVGFEEGDAERMDDELEVESARETPIHPETRGRWTSVRVLNHEVEPSQDAVSFQELRRDQPQSPSGDEQPIQPHQASGLNSDLEFITNPLR